MRKMLKDKGVNIKVHPSLYRQIQDIRKQFKTKYKINNLSTVDMTGSPKLKIIMKLR